MTDFQGEATAANPTSAESQEFITDEEIAEMYPNDPEGAKRIRAMRERLTIRYKEWLRNNPPQDDFIFNITNPGSEGQCQ